MSKAMQTEIEQPANESDQPPSVAAPQFEFVPAADTRTEEQKAADAAFHKQLEEYHALYERGEVGQTAYDSLILYRLAGKFSFIRELQRAYTSQILRYIRPESELGYGLTLDQAIKKAESYREITTAEKLFNELKHRSVGSLLWADLEQLFRLEPAAAEALWQRLKTEAREDFESGSMAAQIFETTEWRNGPWRRARYVGIRDAFIDDYKPRGAVELSMLDMAVTAYFLYYYWTEVMMQRNEREALPELFTYEERKQMERYKGRYEWVPPRVTEQDALEHAAQMADRFRRQYLSAIRALRDYRRYGPVIVQNAEQVNIAADGGQQMNVQQKRRGKSRKKKSGSTKGSKRTTAPKQLSAKQEIIEMKTASESIQVE